MLSEPATDDGALTSRFSTTILRRGLGGDGDVGAAGVIPSQWFLFGSSGVAVRVLTFTFNFYEDKKTNGQSPRFATEKWMLLEEKCMDDAKRTPTDGRYVCCIRSSKSRDIAPKVARAFGVRSTQQRNKRIHDTLFPNRMHTLTDKRGSRARRRWPSPSIRVRRAVDAPRAACPVPQLERRGRRGRGRVRQYAHRRARRHLRLHTGRGGRIDVCKGTSVDIAEDAAEEGAIGEEAERERAKQAEAYQV
jgi:hypothetical protein